MSTPLSPGLDACRLSRGMPALLSLHRPWFAQALQEQPGDLLRHRYGPSVMAIYRSAWRMIEAAREAYKRVSVIPSRFGLVWSVCLASGVRVTSMPVLWMRGANADWRVPRL